jgi:hypothetical protein
VEDGGIYQILCGKREKKGGRPFKHRSGGTPRAQDKRGQVMRGIIERGACGTLGKAGGLVDNSHPAASRSPPAADLTSASADAGDGLISRPRSDSLAGYVCINNQKQAYFFSLVKGTVQ